MYEEKIEQKRREADSIEREIDDINLQEDRFTERIRQYEIAQQRSPQSSNLYAREIENLNYQIDKLRQRRIYASTRLQKVKNDIRFLEKNARKEMDRKKEIEKLRERQTKFLRSDGFPPGGEDRNF